MKKLLIAIATTSFMALSVTGCPGPSGTNPSTNPSSGATVSPSPATTTGGSLATRAAFITYLNCVKTKVPSVAPAIDVHLNIINNLTDAQWATYSASYQAVFTAYSSYGCN